jgi:NAD-dependent dihydropyrimidine dehydrogenase PreA subunit
MVENKAVVNDELCSDCAACVDACPSQAISLS